VVVSKVGWNIGELDEEYLSSETERPTVWNLQAERSAAAPAVEARVSEKAAVALYDYNIV
jgi:hypothetical protein